MKARKQTPAAGGAPRRRFLARAAAAAGLGFPALARAQGPIGLRWQSTWAAKDILHEYALDFAKKVNDMTGGDLRIEVLAAGAVAQPSALLEAVSKGALDGGHGLLAYHYGRHPAFALWGTGPAFGMDANMVLAWHKYGGGRQLLRKLHDAVGANVVSFPYGPMPTQPLGWFRKPIARPEDLKGLDIRAEGLAGEIYAAMGATASALPPGEATSALRRGVLEGAEFNNVSSDRILGFPEVARVCMLQSYHQSAEQLEILFNRAKFEALPPKIRAIIEAAVEAASSDMSWKAIERYSRDHSELREKDGLRMLRTPDTVLRRQLSAFDQVAKERAADPLFREIEESQRRFAQRAVRWYLDTQVSPNLAYSHYFEGKPPARRRPAKK